MKTYLKKAALLAGLAWSISAGGQTPGFLPGSRVLLDAHNCYPYEGRWMNRVDRALATGAPLAIEVDLVWNPKGKPGDARVVVRHGGTAQGGEPSLRAYFFDKIRPAVKKALQEDNRASWPLFTLNINDLRAEEPEFFTTLWALMGEFEPWLCTAVKGADSRQIPPWNVKPVLVLTSDGTHQARVFYEEVPVGGRLRMFASGKADRPADAFRRWVNYPWKEVEPEGQNRAGAWTPEDANRLRTLVDSAHRQGYWIRFYTLNGHPAQELTVQGWTASYNFGSLEAATLRWRAAQAAGVDFIASDQYEDCAPVLRGK